MDQTFLQKCFSLIAKGLLEKEALLKQEPNRYPHSLRLQHGINMFLYASAELGKSGIQVWQYADEASFLEKFAVRPIEEWFSDWSPESISRLNLKSQPFYGFGPFALWEGENRYSPSEDCIEYLESQDADILAGTDERYVYNLLKQLTQNQYTMVRLFIIEHPIVTQDALRRFKMQLAACPQAVEAINFAYEEWEGEAYCCPVCGWTMMQGKYGPICHSPHCTDVVPNLTDDMQIDNTDHSVLRLKKGVMRYFAQPGKLELEIADFCESKNLQWCLWPQMDRYDIEIIFPDGEVWEIDAKAYHNPIALRNKILSNNKFTNCNCAHGYYVIPSAFTHNQKNYTKVVNRVLANQTFVKCITSTTLKREINRKVAQLYHAE